MNSLKWIFGLTAVGTILYMAPEGTAAALGTGLGKTIEGAGGFIEAGGNALVHAFA